MSIAEAALYGDLVRHLRNACAQQLAGLKSTNLEDERTALDDLIRTWFFTPNDELYGYTPQRVIRNEALGIANTIPADRLGEMFEDDCPICRAMREEAEAGLAVDPNHDHGWAFGLAPDFSLLDEYDPEGSDEWLRIEEERMQASHAQRQAEARALPFFGADEPKLAQEVRRRFDLLDDDSIF